MPYHLNPDEQRVMHKALMRSVEIVAEGKPMSLTNTNLAGFDFSEGWLQPGAIVPVDTPTTGALVREVQRLRDALSETQARAEKAERSAARTRAFTGHCSFCGWETPDQETAAVALALTAEHGQTCTANPIAAYAEHLTEALLRARVHIKQHCAPAPWLIEMIDAALDMRGRNQAPESNAQAANLRACLDEEIDP